MVWQTLNQPWLVLLLLLLLLFFFEVYFEELVYPFENAMHERMADVLNHVKSKLVESVFSIKGNDVLSEGFWLVIDFFEDSDEVPEVRQFIVFSECLGILLEHFLFQGEQFLFELIPMYLLHFFEGVLAFYLQHFSQASTGVD